ncbi:hypothetical protein ACVIGA_001703 [Bradyrhizobium sp. USDA 3240]
MEERTIAMLRMHEQNIERYQGLLRTKLSDVETHFIERRLSEERFTIEMPKFMKGVGPVPIIKIVLLDNDVHREPLQGCSVIGPSVSVQGTAMTALPAKLERFEILAVECDLIASREADGSRRALYLRLGARYRQLACDMRSVIASVDAAA